jgi:hypothetical protein
VNNTRRARPSTIDTRVDPQYAALRIPIARVWVGGGSVSVIALLLVDPARGVERRRGVA